MPALLVKIIGFTTETSVGCSTAVVGATTVSPNSEMYVGWYAPGIGPASSQAATIYDRSC
jgi:hypothetical protein